MSDATHLSLSDLRAQRNALQRQEDAVSFVRRLTQGRIDLVLDEERRRATKAPAPSGTLTERLANVFGQEHGGGSARPPRETDVPADHPLLVQLDELCEEFSFENLESLTDADISALRDALTMFEQSCSQQRHQMFEQIDALTAELVARLRDGGTAALLTD
ncbi:MAG: hypothetical protein D4R44_05800 [Actinobacteria bacterium]|jgi:hypothetical protein|nr:MAG: hypothetical protein D4R44_05800 [Actinomycetota bacterium]